MMIRLYVALAALAVVTAACGTTESDSATLSTTTTDESSAELEAVSVDQALTASTTFFTAFNRGDFDAVLAMFDSGATFSNNFTGQMAREVWEQRLVWNIAQGTTLGAPDCAVAEAMQGEPVIVSCETATHNAEIQAVGAPPVPTVVTMVVTPNGIQDLREVFGQPDFLHTAAPFERWMRKNHPDDADKVGFGTWDTTEEAEQNGELIARYAQEWAAYLQANDCTYLDVC